MVAPKNDGMTAVERVCAEQKALEKKIESLEKALANKDFISKLTRLELALLKAQLEAMLEYYNCLTARLSIWRDV